MSLNVQFLTLFSMIGSGAAIGILLDSYRISAIELKWKRWVKSAMDLLFWVFSALLVIFTLQKVNDGQIHLYVFAAIGVGYYSYTITLRSFVMRRVRNFISFMQRCIQLLIKIINMIIVKPILFLYKIGYALFIGFFLLLAQLLFLFWRPLRFLGKRIVVGLKASGRWTWSKLTRKRE